MTGMNGPDHILLRQEHVRPFRIRAGNSLVENGMFLPVPRPIRRANPAL